MSHRSLLCFSCVLTDSVFHHNSSSGRQVTMSVLQQGYWGDGALALLVLAHLAGVVSHKAWLSLLVSPCRFSFLQMLMLHSCTFTMDTWLILPWPRLWGSRLLSFSAGLLCLCNFAGRNSAWSHFPVAPSLWHQPCLCLFRSCQRHRILLRGGDWKPLPPSLYHGDLESKTVLLHNQSQAYERWLVSTAAAAIHVVCSEERQPPSTHILED